MGLGVLTAACCIVRTVLNYQIGAKDETWVGISGFMWRSGETNVGIITACLPTLRPLLRQILGENDPIAGVKNVFKSHFSIRTMTVLKEKSSDNDTTIVDADVENISTSRDEHHGLGAESLQEHYPAQLPLPKGKALVQLKESSRSSSTTTSIV
ncbi:MAG: hypothetical protein LQ351_004953 [Letrouitia transgressa]|nr:MAG: hypothetical protein LQ351_004953 [Letrouitia transgressa]